MNKKYKINTFSLIFILYIFFIIVNDYFCFILKKNVSPLFYIISFILTVLLFKYLRNKIIITKNEYSRLDFVFLLTIALSILSRIVIPDSSFDTLNYHIYSQERLFSDNVSFNFFPARWINTFSFPLSDRIHFFFRYLLGYRLGIIFNLFTLIVIYYQIKIILNKYINNKNYISLIAGLVIITEQIMTNAITYYVDIISIPLFLELIIIILNEQKANNITNGIVLFISGILVSLKVSNAFLLIPIAIIYIIKYKKSINYKTILYGIPIFLFPLLVYLLNNYIQTGNPVFPFYNSIFHSKYLANTNWIETFYGPKRMRERLFWPLYLFICPRRAFDTNIYYGRIGFGYIISIFIIITSLIKYYTKKEKLDLFFYSNLFFIILCLIWSNFMMGYIRYALILEVLSGIIIAITISKYYMSRNIFYFLMSMVCVYSLIVTTTFTMEDMLRGDNDISWRKPYYSDEIGYKNNAKLLLDRRWNYKMINNIDCFGIVDYNSAYASLLSRDKRIININESYTNKYGENEFNKILNKCKNIYTVSTSTTIERTEKYAENAGYKRVGEYISFKADFLDYNKELVLFEIKKSS